MTDILHGLLPCPFCAAGETLIHENKGVWRGNGYGPAISVEIRHWCPPVSGQPSRMIVRIGRDLASAVEAWNTRAGSTIGQDGGCCTVETLRLAGEALARLGIVPDEPETAFLPVEALVRRLAQAVLDR